MPARALAPGSLASHALAGLAMLAAMGLASPASAQGAAPAKKTWKCSAPGMISGSYDGGSQAYIHLEGFSSGGQYAVTRNAAGTIATGTTANGTKFTCKAS